MRRRRRRTAYENGRNSSPLFRTSPEERLSFRSDTRLYSLGRDDAGNVVAAHREENPARYHHVCVTGGGRADFICRLVLTLSCIYDKSEAGFLVLSPRPEYAELLRLKNADVTVPYIRSLADYEAAVTALGELVRVRSMGQGYPPPVRRSRRTGIPFETPADGMLSSYNACFQAVGASGVEVVTGVELHGSIFGGFPGAFVGIGNCLVTVRRGGQGGRHLCRSRFLPDAAPRHLLSRFPSARRRRRLFQCPRLKRSKTLV